MWISTDWWHSKMMLKSGNRPLNKLRMNYSLLSCWFRVNYLRYKVQFCHLRQASVASHCKQIIRMNSLVCWHPTRLRTIIALCWIRELRLFLWSIHFCRAVHAPCLLHYFWSYIAVDGETSETAMCPANAISEIQNRDALWVIFAITCTRKDEAIVHLQL